MDKKRATKSTAVARSVPRTSGYATRGHCSLSSKWPYTLVHSSYRETGRTDLVEFFDPRSKDGLDPGSRWHDPEMLVGITFDLTTPQNRRSEYRVFLSTSDVSRLVNWLRSTQRDESESIIF